jgi:hypothetical protein
MSHLTRNIPSTACPFSRAFRGIGLAASISWLLASAACSSAPLTESPGTGGSQDVAEGGAMPGVNSDGGASPDSALPMVMGGGGDGGHAKDGPAGPPPPPGCDVSKDPKDSLPCLADTYGAFVDATQGDDANDGTKAHPFAHIQAALAKGLPRVYACAGTYAEHVKITSGASVYGGFSCADWSYAAANVVTIAPADAGYAVEIADVADAVLLEDVTMIAPGGTAALPSSIAVFAHGSAAITVKRGIAIAGDGAIGTSSTVGSNYADPVAPSGKPGSAVPQLPAGFKTLAGLAPVCTCANGVISSAGRGFGNPSPTAPTAGLPAIAGMAGGAAGAGACGAGGSGRNGASGGAGKDAPAPTTIGALSALGWSPAGGQGGTFGSVAQGGGGGAGVEDGNGSSGGSGACGGCGGAPATAATGGGASIALLVWESAVTLVSSSLTSGNGGDGGNGSAGQPGQTGGSGGPGYSAGCTGGAGGAGGNGGASAGGGGGVSAGVLYITKTVNAPSVDAATMNAITAGTAGQRGAGGTPAQDGLALPAAKVREASNI